MAAREAGARRGRRSPRSTAPRWSAGAPTRLARATPPRRVLVARRVPARFAAARRARRAALRAPRGAPRVRRDRGRRPRAGARTRSPSGSAAASSRTSIGCSRPPAAARRLRLAARRGRRPAPAGALPRPLRRAVRALRARPRPAGAEPAQPLRLARDAAAAGVAGARDALRRDRAADRLRRARGRGELLPFPELRFGWGLDLHWAALAAERGWRLGVVDATPVRHESARRRLGLRAPRRAGRGRPLPRRPALPAGRARRRGARHPPAGGAADAPPVRGRRHAARRRRAPLGHADPRAAPARRRGAAAVPQRRGPALRGGARRAGVPADCVHLGGRTDAARPAPRPRGGRRAAGRCRHPRREPPAGGRGDRAPRRAPRTCSTSTRRSRPDGRAAAAAPPPAAR